jgi:hypothetical protein
MRILDFLNEFKSMSKASASCFSSCVPLDHLTSSHSFSSASSDHFDFLDDSSFDGSLSARGPMSLFSDSEDDVANPRGFVLSLSLARFYSLRFESLLWYIYRKQ